MLADRPSDPREARSLVQMLVTMMLAARAAPAVQVGYVASHLAKPCSAPTGIVRHHMLMPRPLLCCLLALRSCFSAFLRSLRSGSGSSRL